MHFKSILLREKKPASDCYLTEQFYLIPHSENELFWSYGDDFCFPLEEHRGCLFLIDKKQKQKTAMQLVTFREESLMLNYGDHLEFSDKWKQYTHDGCH